MCDFKPGDEVVCLYAGPWFRVGTGDRDLSGPKEFEVCRINSLEHAHGLIGLFLDGHGDESFASHLFRKVQRRDLSAWVETATDFEEPKRVPVKEAA